MTSAKEIIWSTPEEEREARILALKIYRYCAKMNPPPANLTAIGAMALIIGAKTHDMPNQLVPLMSAFLNDVVADERRRMRIDLARQDAEAALKKAAEALK